MNSSYGLTAENIINALPGVLSRNERLYSLAQAVAKALSFDVELVEKARIYTAIDTLPELLLDELAYDFKVDWWDSEYTLDQKRQVLKDNWYVRRFLGTKASLEKAISAIYPQTKVLEWFEYNGKPYNFKLQIDVSFASLTIEQHQRVLDRVNYYKNLRSHMEEIEFTMLPEGTAHAYAGIALSGISIRITAEVR